MEYQLEYFLFTSPKFIIMRFLKKLYLVFFIAVAITINAQNRVALVIGNADYANIPKLENTISDAKIITDAEFVTLKQKYLDRL